MGPLTEVTINMNQEVYLNILNDQVLLFSQHLLDEYAIVHPIVQDYNCRDYWARRVCDWFDEHSSTLLHLNWPAKSPDVNLIENLWDMEQHQH